VVLLQVALESFQCVALSPPLDAVVFIADARQLGTLGLIATLASCTPAASRSSAQVRGIIYLSAKHE